MGYIYCYEAEICGDVPNINLNATIENQTVNVENILQSSNTSCYFSIFFSNNWTATSTLKLKASLINGFQVHLASGEDEFTAETRYFDI
mmetsp:Transcript_44831/g.43422  ORF Transcript_44831/g.43422 Transcript_44831/m.43422 type:complete len:89 (-) Transcript_44831:709-975(-)